MRANDLERVLAWRNHPEVRRYMYTRHEIRLDEHRQWFERASQDPAKHLLIFAVAGTPTGFVNITQHQQGPIADWGFYLAPEAPRGTGRQLGQSALTFAFGELGLHKLCGQALAFNERSIRFHRRLGFQQEGLLRDQYFDGEQFHSMVCFGLLHHEWPSQSGESI
ncbi:UDP-4-amino-4,6-dideoxy-N-acetyl-beta-L-altrosamine N-acetyltransferase [Pistricoccus aurantiacus]|uniref:UDP-4-amino-4, 6-dideoxy-N-acetyl-beta-L-altrosamine N-acetyltransferase n=2 Tax=Pistricoccus aurantiacus TaxID=1883414 RepID=A0A5B8SWV3_9GAMM|nr:UDP-4-amino-4,6-dideoxy-N-acetyl-beta-L-altrosamine N-acetyltransferase [Pistricoccus aurantiacus]